MKNGRLPRASAIALLVAGAAGCGSIVPPKSIAGPPASVSVHVRVQAKKGVELWQLPSPGSPDAGAICAAPCTANVALPPNRFEARVQDLPDSPPFSVPSSKRGVVLKVETAPKVLLGLAAVTGTVGVASMLIGAGVAIGDVAGNDALAGAAVPGAITVAIGSAVLAAGVVLAALSGTHVRIREAAARPAAISF